MNITLNHIAKQFDQKILWKDLNLTIPEGRINCLMGASGSGKTTLINIIMGLIQPDSGNILGLEDKRIAAVFQEDRLIEHWNAVKNIKLVCRNEISLEKIKYELGRLGLSEDLDKPVCEFSGGMRRRVAVTRALSATGNLLIMDEPFRGLDSILKNQLIDYIKQKTKGRTVIIITHEKEDVDLLEANLLTLI